MIIIVKFWNNNLFFRSIDGASRYPMTDVLYLRTHSQWEEHIRLASEGNDVQACFGIKGTTPLARLEYIHLNTIAPLDMFHSQLIGTAKLMIDSWCGRIKNVDRKLTETDMNIIEQNSSSIRMPCNQLRTAPKLNSKVAWKATDYENFVFYCTMSLENVLDKQTFDNFCIFVKILSTLCKSKIESADIDCAKDLVQDFFVGFRRIYPARMWRYNVHCLAHMVDMVERFGPLYQSSAFNSENAMGVLVRRVETGHNVQQQVYNKTLIHTSVIGIQYGSHPLPEMVTQFFEVLSAKKPYFKVPRLQLKEVNPILSEDENKILGVFFYQDVRLYNRVKFHNLLITTSKSSLGKSSANEYVVTKNGYFRVIKICHLQQENSHTISPGEIVLLCRKY